MSSRTRKLLGLAIAIVCCTALATSLTWGTKEPPPDAGGRRLVEVSLRDISSAVLATGIIKPSVGAEVRVGSRVSGVVKHLHVEIGDQVEQGQLLGELDPTEYQARYHQAEAALENARAELAFATLELERQESLLERSFTSQRLVDQARAAYDLARAAVKEGQARLAYEQVQLDYTRISAPITGVVATVSTQEGETVAASLAAPTFVVIIDLDRLEVWAYVDETDIGRIARGQRATFSVDTYPDLELEGVVTAIYPKAEMKDNVVNYVTIIDIVDPKTADPKSDDPKTGDQKSGDQKPGDQKPGNRVPGEPIVLRPEMTTTCRIYQESRQDVPILPAAVLHRDGPQRYVYLPNGESSMRRNVGVGWSDGTVVEITSGLEPGEQVLAEHRKEHTQ